MTAPSSIDPARFLHEQLAQASKIYAREPHAFDEDSRTAATRFGPTPRSPPATCTPTRAPGTWSPTCRPHWRPGESSCGSPEIVEGSLCRFSGERGGLVVDR